VAKAQEDLHRRIKTLEDELQTALEEKERAFRYLWVKGKAKFEQEVLSQHKDLKYWLPSYILHSRVLAVITAPLIYLGFFPFCFLDVFLRYIKVCVFRARRLRAPHSQCVVTLSIRGL
jgi:hypothetical protein